MIQELNNDQDMLKKQRPERKLQTRNLAEAYAKNAQTNAEYANC